MQRRSDWIFGITVLASVLLETYALSTIVIASFGATRTLLHGSTVATAMVRGLGLTVINAAAVTLVILILHVVTAARREHDRSAVERWLALLARSTALSRAPEDAMPSRPPRAALEALLQLRDALTGEAAVAAGELLRRCEPLESGKLVARSRTRFERLDAFETLARARLPETLSQVYPYLDHPDPTTRFAAARAAARIADAETAHEVADVLAGTPFGRRAWLEILLLHRTPEPLVRVLLASHDRGGRWAAVETIRRRHLLGFVDAVLRMLAEEPAEDDELLAAALRALAGLRIPPAAQATRVLSATRSEADFVRLQAVRVLPLLSDERTGQALWDRLADRSFYVRQAAAQALGTIEPRLLLRASESHPDRYGRAMARQEFPVAHAA